MNVSSFKSEVMKKTILVTFLSLTCVASFAQLTGEMRAAVLSSGKASCFQNQRSMAPKNVPDNTLKQYCNCSMTYLVDRTTNEQMIAVYQGKAQMPVQLMSAGTEYCQSNASKYSAN